MTNLPIRVLTIERAERTRLRVLALGVAAEIGLPRRRWRAIRQSYGPLAADIRLVIMREAFGPEIRA